MDKQQANGSGETLVTFRLPADVRATAVSVVGEFNGWSTEAHRMRREADAFTAVIPLMPGRAYRFRYLLDGERWRNDWAADAYVPNEFGGEDSLVDLLRRRSSVRGRRRTIVRPPTRAGYQR
jgi:1,4-alpha-glucan branching enzyme